MVHFLGQAALHINKNKNGIMARMHLKVTPDCINIYVVTYSAKTSTVSSSADDGFLVSINCFDAMNKIDTKIIGMIKKTIVTQIFGRFLWGS